MQFYTYIICEAQQQNSVISFQNKFEVSRAYSFLEKHFYLFIFCNKEFKFLSYIITNQISRTPKTKERQSTQNISVLYTYGKLSIKVFCPLIIYNQVYTRKKTKVLKVLFTRNVGALFCELFSE